MLNRSAFGATESQWQDWHWQLSHCVKNVGELEALCGVSYNASETERVYPMLTTPFYLSLAHSFDEGDPVIRQILPQPQELQDYPECTEDGLEEEAFSPVPRLVHRYRDRVVFLTCSACCVRCRHCLRKRLWGKPVPPPSNDDLQKCVDYLNAHAEIREVLISGGDPLMLSDAALERVLAAFASVPNIKVLRIGSRTLVAMPQRITEKLCAILEKCGKTVWFATHFNHPFELSEEASAAVLRLMHSGVPVVNQSVLLKGINDSAEVLAELFTRLLDMRIKPYYLFHGDPIKGAGCFRTGIEKGLEIMAELRGKVSGMALPAFAFDLPEGGGKIRLEPDFSCGVAPNGAPIFRKLNGEPVIYN